MVSWNTQVAPSFPKCSTSEGPLTIETGLATDSILLRPLHRQMADPEYNGYKRTDDKRVWVVHHHGSWHSQ